MKNIIIARRNKDLKVLDFKMEYGKGTYRVITKCKAGFATSHEVEGDSPYQVFRRYQIKHVQAIEYVKDINGTNYAFTVYARTGKKVWVCNEILENITVGDINQELFNTALYNQEQYKSVNAKTWADKAYVMNEEEIGA